MIVEVLAVGTELLLGQIVNGNAATIGSRLAAAGLDHYRQVVVGDNRERLTKAIGEAAGRCDVLIVTGGIGPTQDDLTREALAAAAGVPLERSPAEEDRLRSWWESRGREMPSSNLRQAERPVGAEFVPNPKGTAPGLRMQVGNCLVFALPGVPEEMVAMLDAEVMPHLAGLRGGQGGAIVSRLLRTWGESESRLAEILGDLYESGRNPTLAFLASGGEIKLRLTARAAGEDDARRLIDPVEEEIRSRLGSLVFGADAETVEAVLLGACRHRHWTLGTAESATAGMVAAAITSVPGSSEVFRGGIVAYSAEVKEALLGIPSRTLHQFGLVSSETAEAMAQGGRRALGADVVAAITGSAGPDRLEAPAGTMVIAVATPDRCAARTLRLPGDRERVRTYATTSALHLARLAVTGDWW